MIFVSWQFLVFLTIVFLAYWRFTYIGRIYLLAISSCIFYGFWDPRFLALLSTSAVIDYYCGLAIAGKRRGTPEVFIRALLPATWLFIYGLYSRFSGETSFNTNFLLIALLFTVLYTTLYHLLKGFEEAKRRRAFLLLSIISNLSVLGFFKYANFFSDSLVTLTTAMGLQVGWTLPNIILPIAISFYTFQSICYSVDIYKGKVEPMRDFMPFFAYLSFFPQLIAGPIERPSNILPQFRAAAEWNYQNIHTGTRLILIGFFKKVFVADNCALIANYAFASDTELNGYWAILGVLAFAFQIYGDFSGYTDIARGSARMLGINLSNNFAFPYFAKSPSDFWRRWHMTLSTWFRDYVYIPLGGNKGGAAGRNAMITMLLAGLWHGASWKFVLWGGYSGLLLILYNTITWWRNFVESAGRSVAKNLLSVSFMFTLTLLGWSIFRVESMGDFGEWLMAFTLWEALPGTLDWVPPSQWLLIHIVPLFILQIFTWKERDEASMDSIHWVARGIAYLFLIILVSTSMVNDQEFIYFQF